MPQAFDTVAIYMELMKNKHMKYDRLSTVK